MGGRLVTAWYLLSISVASLHCWIIDISSSNETFEASDWLIYFCRLLSIYYLERLTWWSKNEIHQTVTHNIWICARRKSFQNCPSATKSAEKEQPSLSKILTCHDTNITSNHKIKKTIFILNLKIYLLFIYLL